MSIKTRIPRQFYKLFASKYVEYYELILITLYEESGQSYSLLGLTEEECQDIISEKIGTFTMDWSQEQFEDEGELLTRSNMASLMLHRLEEWGWLHKDYDETLNQYVVSFPDYSQMFVDVFQRLFRDEGSMERESILAVYSHLFTYSSDKEKNNEILRSALQTSKALLQMLANMQEGIRGYFESLSSKNTFLGIQEVLVNEMNNTYSAKYAILTTTDSFYRYKEEVKELIEKNLSENEVRKQIFIGKRTEFAKDTPKWHRNERMIGVCDEAMEILFQINREFDSIERRYNRLIDQKRIFAKRAAARIRYILAEGDVEEDRTKALVRMLNDSSKRENMIEELGQRYGLTERFQVMKEKSFARPREVRRPQFTPQKIVEVTEENLEMDSFVVKPLYTKAQLQEFRRKNEVDGTFSVTHRTVQSMEDLEKLLFIWQDATETMENELEIEIGEDFQTADGMKYSGFSIRRK